VAVKLAQDTAAAVTFYPEGLTESRPASATLSFKNSGGTQKEAPTATLATVGSGGSASVSTVTSQSVVVVDNATGFTPGEWVWLETADGFKGPVEVDEVASTTITLAAPPPGTLTTAAVFYGFKLTTTLLAASTADRGTNYRFEWSVTDAAGSVHLLQQMAHVVRMRFPDAVTASEIKRYVVGQWPGESINKTAGWFRGLARRASARVKRLLQANGDYPHLMGEHSVFAEVGLAAAKVELIDEGLVPAGRDPDTYFGEAEDNLSRRLREARAETWVDRDDSGGVTADEIRGLTTVRAMRR